MADARLNIGVTADAKTASATFKELAADIKNVGKESVAVTDGVAKVDAALAKLAKAPDTPMALAKATAKLKLEVDELRTTLDKTPASAEQMKSISAALAQADQAIKESIQRAGKLGEAHEEVKQKMGLTAKGAESLGNSFGSLDGIMGKMADSSSKASQNVAKIGFSVLAAGQAFEFGYSAGEKFRKGLEAIGVTLPDFSAKAGAAVLAIESMVRGYKEAELVEGTAINRARQIIALREAQAVSEAALAKAMQAAGVEWKDANAEREKTIAKLNAIEQALSRTGKSEEAYNAAVRENSKTILEAAKAADAQGISLSKVAPRVAEAARVAQELADAQKGVAEATKDTSASLEQEVDALNKAVDAAVRMRQQAEAEGVAQRNRTTATEASERAQRTWNEATHDGVTEMNGWVGVAGSAQMVYLTIARASDEATAALLRQAEATRALREEQAQSLEAAKGWTDYIITLQQGYETGAMSLYNYVTELTRFKTQLQQIFGGVTGEAKKELQAMIDLIQKLISTAGAGGGGSAAGGYAGQFQRDANKRGK